MLKENVPSFALQSNILKIRVEVKRSDFSEHFSWTSFFLTNLFKIDILLRFWIKDIQVLWTIHEEHQEILL